MCRLLISRATASGCPQEPCDRTVTAPEDSPALVGIHTDDYHAGNF